MDRKMQEELMGWATHFSEACLKLREGMDTPGSAVTLTQEECAAIVDYLRISVKEGER